MLELSRGLQGVGGAAMFASSLALLANAFRGKDRGIAFGVWGAITGLAVAIGPLVGGALVTGISWRWIFFVNLPIGVLAVALTADAGAGVAGRRRRAGRTGPVSCSSPAALACLIYALIESGRSSFGATAVVACFAAAAVLLVAFVVVERRVAQPMFDLSLFRLPTFAGGDIAAFGVTAGDLLDAPVPRPLPAGRARLLSALQTGVRTADHLRRDPRQPRRGRAAHLPGARCAR